MAIDIRATVSCSLGPVISGNLNDDYIQGSGLIRTRGSILLNGTFTPAAGTIVTFSYIKAGVTRSIPRKVRVLSSFADPFRGTTQVELGCKLTYLENLAEQDSIGPKDDPANDSLLESDYDFISPPISASAAMSTCLTKLGITAASDPLTNKFCVAKFDFTGGYVEVLSNLLLSECYLGYLDYNEILQLISTNQEGGTGPVYSSSSIIELSPIGVGERYSDNVAVNFSTRKLRQPLNDGDSYSFGIGESYSAENELRRRRWEFSESTGSPVAVRIDYEDPATGDNAQVVYNYVPYSSTTSVYDNDKIVSEITSSKAFSPALAGNFYSERLTNGYSAGSYEIMETERTIYSYPSDNETIKTTTFLQDALRIAGSANISFIYDDILVTPPIGLIATEKNIEVILELENFRKTTSSTWRAWSFTPEGQQAISKGAESITTAADATNFLDALAFAGLHYVGTTTQSNSSYEQILDPLGLNVTLGPSFTSKQNRPSVQTLIANSYTKNEDGLQSSGELIMATGDPTSENRITFTLPYAPDDIFTKTMVGYSTIPSDARQKAINFGRIQNKLLFGNRYGMSLQVVPESLPAAPFSPLFVQASGLTAMYRVNGSGWTFDSNGIIASVDALFWGGVGTS